MSDKKGAGFKGAVKQKAAPVKAKAQAMAQDMKKTGAAMAHVAKGKLQDKGFDAKAAAGRAKGAIAKEKAVAQQHREQVKGNIKQKVSDHRLAAKDKIAAAKKTAGEMKAEFRKK